jgi:hypothetical protein
LARSRALLERFPESIDSLLADLVDLYGLDDDRRQVADVGSCCERSVCACFCSVA